MTADPDSPSPPGPTLASILAFGEPVAQAAATLNARLLALTADAARRPAAAQGWLAALKAPTAASAALSRLGRTIAQDARTHAQQVEDLAQLRREIGLVWGRVAAHVRVADSALDAWRTGALSGLEAPVRLGLVARLEQRRDHLAGLVVVMQQGECTAAERLAAERGALAALEEARDVTQPLALRRRAGEELACDVRRTASAFVGVDDFAQSLLAEDRRRLDQTLRGRR